MTRTMAHTISKHSLALAYAAFVGVAVYFLSGAGFGWFVLEQHASYGITGPQVSWDQPVMLAPAVLIGLFFWARAEAEPHAHPRR